MCISLLIAWVSLPWTRIIPACTLFSYHRQPKGIQHSLTDAVQHASRLRPSGNRDPDQDKLSVLAQGLPHTA